VRGTPLHFPVSRGLAVGLGFAPRVVLRFRSRLRLDDRLAMLLSAPPFGVAALMGAPFRCGSLPLECAPRTSLAFLYAARIVTRACRCFSGAGALLVCPPVIHIMEASLDVLLLLGTAWFSVG
jgi:hypothetical protein